MNVKLKTFIICIIAAFIFGIIVAGGTVYLLYKNSNNKYREQIELANELNKQLNLKLTESVKSVNELRKVNRELVDSIKSSIEDTKGIADLNRELRELIDKGSSKE